MTLSLQASKIPSRQRSTVIDVSRLRPKDLKGKYCAMPWHSIDVGINGEVSLCQCAGWMIGPAGNIWDHDLPTILSGATAKAIRDSILNGDYSYCNDDLCQIIKSGSLVEFDQLDEHIKCSINRADQFQMPRFISLAVDLTCNLSCPSCRTKILRVHPEDQQQLKIMVDRLYNNLFSVPSDQDIWVTVSTSGEIFASELLMDMLARINVDHFPNLRLHLQTNGLLARSRWSRLGDKQHRVGRVTVSIDAGTADTYEKVRRGGRWNELLDNLEFISERKQAQGFELHSRMVVQHTNYREMERFYEISDQIGADLIEFCRVTDWHSWNPDEFPYHDVFDPDHPEHDQAQAIMESLSLKPKFWSNC